MKIVYLIIVLLVLYAGVSYLRFNYLVSHAHLPVIRQADQTFGTGPALRYIAAGDSTAVGEGASSVEQTYTYRVAKYLAQTHMVSYRNVAVVGSETQDVINNQLAQIVSYQPDVVTISIGANDMTHLQTDAHVLANFKTIIQTLTQKTHTTIYLTDIPNFSWADLLPWPYRKILDYQIKPLNAQLLSLQTDRVKFVDIYNFGWSNYPDLSLTNSADHFHPNDLGYDNWTNAFLSKIKAQY